VKRKIIHSAFTIAVLLSLMLAAHAQAKVTVDYNKGAAATLHSSSSRRPRRPKTTRCHSKVVASLM